MEPGVIALKESPMNMFAVCIFLLVMIASVIAVLLLYGLARGSRRQYQCPQCGETIEMEYLDAKRCNACGARLSELP